MTRFARIVTRGDVNDIRSDIGSLDLFTVSASLTVYICKHIGLFRHHQCLLRSSAQLSEMLDGIVTGARLQADMPRYKYAA